MMVTLKRKTDEKLKFTEKKMYDRKNLKNRMLCVDEWTELQQHGNSIR